MMVKKRRRRRRKRYRTGVHRSPKAAVECRYRSGWELEYMVWLDGSDDVVAYRYEGVRIPYVSNIRTGRTRGYYPDLIVEYRDGRVELVEIKPSRRLGQATVQKKLLAAREWCDAHGASLVVITERELRSLGLLVPRKSGGRVGD